MEYIAKKINMIDILGMLIPGGLTLLILEQDIQCLVFLTEMLGGVGASNLIWCVIFLCGSYLVGMLLHEIGSVIEKLLWTCPLTSPRVYAAIITDMYNKYYKVKISNDASSNISSEEPENSDKWRNVAQKVVSGLAIIIAAAVICLCIGCSNFYKLIIGIPITLAVLSFLNGLCQTRYCIDFCSEFIFKTDKSEPEEDESRGIKKDAETEKSELDKKCDKRNNSSIKNRTVKKSRNKLYGIVLNEGNIRRQSIGDEENTRKRILFDGYRALMRSVLVMLAVLQLYVILIGEESALASCASRIASTPAYKFLRILIVVALVMRYWHYSCTKYVYMYNGYLYNKDADENPLNNSPQETTPNQERPQT